MQQSFGRLLSDYNFFWISELFTCCFLFAFSKVFGGLRVAVVLDWEKIRHVYQLLFVEVLRRTHHRLVLVTAEITLHMLHVYEVGTLGGVSDTTSRTRSPK